MEKKIDVTPAIWIEQKRERTIKENKAKAYLDRCEQKNASKQRKRKKIVVAGVCLAIIACGLVAYKPVMQKVSANETETITTETEYVYPDCNVFGQYEKDGLTYLICEMPNGELRDYIIEDAPEGKIDLVCFVTDNQDDYESYEVANAIQLTGNLVNLNNVVSCDVTENGIQLNLEDGTGYYIELTETN